MPVWKVDQQIIELSPKLEPGHGPTSPKVDLEVIQHHARAGEVSPDLGDERAAGSPAPGRKGSVRIRDQIRVEIKGGKSRKAIKGEVKSPEVASNYRD
jgi:hypothetical protein